MFRFCLQMRLVLLFSCLFLISSGFPQNSSFLNTPQDSTADSVTKYKITREKGSLTRPLLDVEFESSQDNALKEKIVAFIDSMKENGLLIASVSFQDLISGVGFAINENEKFTPRSLLKVPVMIAVLKEAEQDSSFLNKIVPYKEALGEDYVNVAQAGPRIQLGESYSIDSLMYRSIVYSDNNATLLLRLYLETNYLENFYRDIGIANPYFGITPDGQNTMSVKKYSVIFRVLFNSSYLSRKMSEKALGLLSQSEFDLGLAAGVDSGIVVANKFGENDFNGVKQLHDVGIIYFPDNPYLLCVMTKGTNWDVNTRTVAGISRIVYQEYLNRSKK